MSLYAISDLHLSLGTDKPMDVFGKGWSFYTERLQANWEKKVRKNDTVLVPGDISWAMDFEQAYPDMAFLEALPGRKIITKGNHDYWWSTVAKIEKFFLEEGFHSLDLLKNNSYIVEDRYIVCGTRGWMLPGDSGFTEKDKKILLREEGRLGLSLEHAKKNGSQGKEILVMMHYPPLNENLTDTPFTELMKEYKVSQCLYGHIHDKGLERCVEGDVEGIKYTNISADKIAFDPLYI